MSKSMQAAQFRRFGPPEVLEVVTVPRPIPGQGEVLVRVAASAVNPHDTFVRDGTMKMMTGRKFPMGVGLDFAGHVVSVGPGVLDVNVGEHVWGMVSPKGSHVTGAAADYVVIAAGRVARAPSGLTAIEAASLVTSGTTAIRAVREVANVQSGQRVLVRGAAGGVGMIVVQLAHSLHAHVTALASARDADFVRSCGADETYDYQQVTAKDIGRFDAIIDTAGSGMSAFRRALSRGGRMVTTNFGSPRAMGAIAWSTWHGPGRIRSFSSNAERPELTALEEYVSAKAIRPIINAVYPLTHIVEAHQALFSPGRHGKSVLRTS